MTTYEVLGLIGAPLVAIAYISQIAHLIAKHCAYETIKKPDYLSCRT